MVTLIIFYAKNIFSIFLGSLTTYNIIPIIVLSQIIVITAKVKNFNEKLYIYAILPLLV